MTSRKIQPADYSYWLMVKDWDSNEAAYLLLGIEPRSLPLWSKDQSGDERKATEQHEKLRRVLTSAVIVGDFGKVTHADEGRTITPPISWLDWVSWAKRNGIDCVDELQNAIAELKDRKDAAPDDIHPRRETTLLRVIAALLHVLSENSKESEASIIRQLDDLFGHIPGLSKSTLERDFADAKRRLKEY